MTETALNEKFVEARVSYFPAPNGRRSLFIGLVPRAEGHLPSDTIAATDAHVDIDAEGNPIGVTVFWKDDA